MEYGYNLLKYKHNPFGDLQNGIRWNCSIRRSGLIRIYTPYLEHDEFVVTNFVAFEPIDKAKIIGAQIGMESLDVFVENVLGGNTLKSLIPYDQDKLTEY